MGWTSRTRSRRRPTGSDLPYHRFAGTPNDGTRQTLRHSEPAVPSTWCDGEEPNATQQTPSHCAERSGLTFWRGRGADSGPDGERRPVCSGLAIRDPQFPEHT